MIDISLAIEMLEQGRREDAVRELEKILAEDINQIAAWRLLASAVTQPNEIKECYEHVLRLDPHDAEAIEVLRSLGAPESPGDGMPFFQDDLAELEPSWNLDEPPVKPGIDTSPVKMIAAEMAPYPQVGDEQDDHPGRSSEAMLFDDEEEPVKEKSAGILENDAFFYTMIIVVIVAVLAILFYVFRGSLLPLIENLLEQIPLPR
jgi:hypothetical protein